MHRGVIYPGWFTRWWLPLRLHRTASLTILDKMSGLLLTASSPLRSTRDAPIIRKLGLLNKVSFYSRHSGASVDHDLLNEVAHSLEKRRGEGLADME